MCYVVGCGVDYEEILLDGGDVVSWMALFCVAGLFFSFKIRVRLCLLMVAVQWVYDDD